MITIVAQAHRESPVCVDPSGSWLRATFEEIGCVVGTAADARETLHALTECLKVCTVCCAACLAVPCCVSVLCALLYRALYPCCAALRASCFMQ